jgi:hypothetical protein
LIEDRWPLESKAWSGVDKCLVAIPDGLDLPADGPLTSDELLTASGAIRCWLSGVKPQHLLPAPYGALADRLSTAALKLLTPVSN